MLEETDTEETIGYFYHWWHFSWEGPGLLPTSLGYAYANEVYSFQAKKSKYCAVYVQKKS